MNYKYKFLIALSCILIGIAGCKKEKEVIPNVTNVPEVTLSNEIIITTLGSDFFMEADLADESGLKSFSLRYDDWFLFNTISLEDLGNPKSYKLKYKFKMPDTAANKIHSITLITTNIGNKQTSKQYKVSINTDFPKMYLTETTDPMQLANDYFGVPMVVEKVGSYSYEAKYYSSAPNSKIWFIPVKSSAKPIAYGLDPANPTKLTGDFNTAKPIVLPNVGYYQISFNTLNLSYTVTPMAAPNPSGAFPQVSIAGRGFTEFPNMNYQNELPNIILLDKDPVNPYLFSRVVKLGVPAGQSYNTASFIFTTNNGWTNFWRFDNANDPEKTVFGGGTEASVNISSVPVTCKITFDTYLNRVKLERQ